MKVKWRLWWIVPLILTILFEVVATFGLLLAMAPGSRQQVFWDFFISYSQGYYFAWPLFLGLAWPAALLTHVAWKRRKVRKQGVLPEVQLGYPDALQDRHGHRYHLYRGATVTMKRWRWWIVPLILTIPFEVVAASGLALAQAPGSGQMVFWYSIRPYHGLYFAWPLFLGLVWPTALIIHGIWKRRKANKTTDAKGEEERL